MFDCEGWVEFNKTKYRRLVRFESCNETDIYSMHAALLKFKIKSRVKKRLNRTMWRLDITGRENLQNFSKYINFLHEKKLNLLKQALISYK